MEAGEFSASQLLEVRLKAEQMWTDSQLAASLKPEAEAARAVLAHQTARFDVFDDINKDKKVKVTFIDACGVQAQDCVESCDISGNELSTGAKEYEPNICQIASFSVDVTKLRTNDYGSSEVVAQGLAAAVKALDEYWSQKVLAKLKTFAGVNVAPNPFTYDNTNKTTVFNSLDPAIYKSNLQLLANFIQQAKLNRIAMPYIIDNGTFFVDMLNAAFDSGNAEGKGYAARLKAFADMLYDDQFNFGAAGLTDSLFMIGGGAVAFKTVNKHPDVPTLIGGKVQQTIYTIPSNLLPNVKYDVTYTIECKIVNNKKHYVHVWELKTHGLIELNPEGCPVTWTDPASGQSTIVSPTGVLSYTKGNLKQGIFTKQFNSVFV